MIWPRKRNVKGDREGKLENIILDIINVKYFFLVTNKKNDKT